MHTFLTVLDILFNIAWVLYVWSGLLMNVWKFIKPHKERPWILNTLWKWAKWPAFLWLIADPVLTLLLQGHLAWYDDLTFLMNVWIWYAYKDAGDDDLSTKVKKKAKEIVQQVGGKLVVVPQAA